MNFIDIAILGILILSICTGWYRGFVSSAVSLIGFFASFVFATRFYSVFLDMFYANSTLMSTLLHYTEGSITISDVEIAHSAVRALSPDALRAAVEGASMPYPLAEFTLNNMGHLAFEANGLTTVTDYINQTIVTFSLHMLCIVVVFFVAFLIFSLANEFVGYVFRYPVLKIADGPAGAVLGFARGVFFAFFVFAFIPIVLAILPLEPLRDAVAESRFAQYFYQSNLLFDALKDLTQGGFS